jgi:esterase/lipase superfamily enzyme
MTNSAITTLTSDAGLSVGVGPTVVVVDAGTARSMTTTTVQSDVYAFLFNEQSLMAYLGIQGQTIDVDKQPGTGAFVGKQNSALASGNPAPRPQQQQVQQAPPIGQPRRAGSNGRYDVVRVFFGTDRGATIDSAGTPQFNGDHATTLTYGSVDVSIPRDHEIGRIESPSVMRLEFSSDSSRDVTILGIGIATYDQFLSEIRSTALNASTPSVLLFIHGYWVTFEDAALRTAQMAYDLDFVGAPVFFSWPARGDFLGYLHDEQAIERAQGDIEKFVAQILAASPGANLYVIAHSMGTRGMTRALVNFARDHPSDASRIREVILAAPDIDTDVFVSQIAPSLVAIGAPVTLYASSTDRALRLSEWIHGGPRAGDAGDHLVLLKGIETVDVTNVDTDLAGHSYVGDRRTVLSDLYDLIQSDKRASKRFGLSQQTRNGMDYWVFRH